ncbi:MAG: WecB/TagA/CpsF family glycosyltransferase [Bacteroidales bacterium]|jgi:N-acetylglucosaminyldiphosphoundecaprenol N-acetyl-beta-D-mannosaminyltransferase|nr:WecB/TagA/CpsF family glycosyltransferase [Bacteroidales bacterium]
MVEYYEYLFGLKIYTGGKENILGYISNRKEKIHIVSGNAEVLKKLFHNKNQFEMFAREDNIIIPDGISVYYPLKMKAFNCKKLPGIELMQLLLAELARLNETVYFLGAKHSVIDKMIQEITVAYPRLKIAGYHHGYFDKSNCTAIVEDIKKAMASALFVALGTPVQEQFIFEYMDELPCKIFMGVGGSFDVLSNTIKRSPRWMRAIGIEWLYRLIKDPSKIGRLWNNTIFTLRAFIYG